MYKPLPDPATVVVIVASVVVNVVEVDVVVVDVDVVDVVVVGSEIAVESKKFKSQNCI